MDDITNIYVFFSTFAFLLFACFALPLCSYMQMAVITPFRNRTMEFAEEK